MTDAEYKETHKDAKKRWFYRRVMSFASLGVMATLISYLTVLGDGGNAVQLMLAQTLPLGFVGIVMARILLRQRRCLFVVPQKDGVQGSLLR